MTDRLLPRADELLTVLAASGRGPRQHGIFALWLFMRSCDGVLPPAPLSGRVHRRRLQAVERRLSSLSLPAPLKRALTLALRELAEGNPAAAALALQHLVAPARETLGTDVGEVVTLAAREAKEAARDADTTTAT